MERNALDPVHDPLRLSDELFNDMSFDAAFLALAAAVAQANRSFNKELLNECRAVAISRLGADALMPFDFNQHHRHHPARIWRGDYAGLIGAI